MHRYNKSFNGNTNQSKYGIDDLFDVKSELEPIIARRNQIELALRLNHVKLKKSKKENTDVDVRLNF